jgi:hypothetical protein
MKRKYVAVLYNKKVGIRHEPAKQQIVMGGLTSSSDFGRDLASFIWAHLPRLQGIELPLAHPWKLRRWRRYIPCRSYEFDVILELLLEELRSRNGDLIGPVSSTERIMS